MQAKWIKLDLFKTNLCVPNVPPYKLTFKVEMIVLIHKIKVSTVASAHELRHHYINVHMDVGTTLLKSGTTLT